MKKTSKWFLLLCAIVSIVILAVGIKIAVIAEKTMFSSELIEDLKQFNLDEKAIEVTIEFDDSIPDWAPSTPDAELTAEQSREFHTAICEGFFERLNLSGYTSYDAIGTPNHRYAMLRYDSFADAIIDIFPKYIVSGIGRIEITHIDYVNDPVNFSAEN